MLLNHTHKLVNTPKNVVSTTIFIFQFTSRNAVLTLRNGPERGRSRERTKYIRSHLTFWFILPSGHLACHLCMAGPSSNIGPTS
jgi:hypothetical protein